MQFSLDGGVLGGQVAAVHRGRVAELFQRAVKVDDHELALGGPDRTRAEHLMADLTVGQVGQFGGVDPHLLQFLLAFTNADAQLGAGRFLLSGLGAFLCSGAAGIAARVELLGVGRVQDIVHQQMQLVIDAAKFLRHIGLVQGNKFRVAFQLGQQVVAHSIVAWQVQCRTAAEIGLVVKIFCPGPGLGRIIKIVVVGFPQVQEKHRVGRVHRVLGHPREHATEPAVDLVGKQLGAAAALGDIAVIFFEQPAEALPHQLYFCLPQHQGLHAADGLQGRVVQRQLCLLHGVRKHTGEVAVLDIPVHAEAVGRTPDRSLFGGGAGLAILNVLCQNPIQIFRVQVNSSS